MTDFLDHKKFTTTHKSVAETGAKVGDHVVCCGVRDDADIGPRYTIGKKYRVVKAGTGIGVEGNSHGKDFGDTGKWVMPFLGFGADWAITAQ